MKGSKEADAAADEARKHGCTDVKIVQGGKHYKIYYTYNGQRMFSTSAASGSDWRGPMNARRDVRHMIGIERPKRIGKKRTRKNYAEPRMTEMPALTIGRDPFDGFKMEYLKSLPVDQVWRLWWDGLKGRADDINK